MARRLVIPAVAAVFAVVVVLVLFVHLSHRNDLLDDVIAVPAGTPAVRQLAAKSTTLRLPSTKVRHAGDVALRMTVNRSRSNRSALVVRVISARGRRLATCRFARGTFADTNVLRCPVADLGAVDRVRIQLVPRSAGLGVVGTEQAVGQLLVPRSATTTGRLGTILGRIGAKHPAAFSGWIVPIGSVVWLMGLFLAAAAVVRARDPADAGE